MKIETSRFIMEELSSEDKTEYFAQISKKMAWKDTVEILLNEKKLEIHIINIAKKDMALFLRKKQKTTQSLLQNGLLTAQQLKIKKQQNVFNDYYQKHMLDICIDKSRAKILGYRQQIINEIKNKLGIDFENDKEAFKKFKNIDFSKIQNENLNPPIPIDDWHYNIQFLKPNINETEQTAEEDLWFSPIDEYIQAGISANDNKEKGFYYFKITDKSTGQIVGISRVCTKAKDFIINYDHNNKPIEQTCVGDPGLFLDPSCQGCGRGSEIYATTLNVLYNFLLKEEDKDKYVVIKCNRLNQASQSLQKSIGATFTNERKTINHRYYFTVNEQAILQSDCLSKLEKLGVDTYTITLDNGSKHKVSLRGGIIETPKNTSEFFTSMQNMMQKVKLSRMVPKKTRPSLSTLSIVPSNKKLDSISKTN